MGEVRYRVAAARAGFGGQWEDPVGEAKGIVSGVLKGWEREIPKDAQAALDRAMELLTFVVKEQST
jgi:hypothetical protein